MRQKPNWKRSAAGAAVLIGLGLLAATSEPVQSYLVRVQRQLDEELAEEAMQNPNALRNPLVHVQTLEPCIKMNQLRAAHSLELIPCG